MNASIRKFLKEEDGVTALEYGLLAALIAGVLVTVAGEKIQPFFEALFDKLATAANVTVPTGGGSAQN